MDEYRWNELKRTQHPFQYSKFVRRFRHAQSIVYQIRQKFSTQIYNLG